MGTINHGIMGGFSGTVGTVVGANWNGIDFMRSRLTNRTDSKTVAQLDQRARLTAIIEFLKPLKDFLRVGFKSQAVKMSAYNAATSCNMANALKGTFPDYQIDYSKVMVSRGKLPGALNPKAVVGSASEIGFTWENNSAKINARADDKAVLVIYNPVKEKALSDFGGSTRIGGSQRINLPASFSGDEVHCYISFQNVGQSVISNSSFVGSLVVL
jgi:hypothetical protein